MAMVMDRLYQNYVTLNRTLCLPSAGDVARAGFEVSCPVVRGTVSEPHNQQLQDRLLAQTRPWLTNRKQGRPQTAVSKKLNSETYP